MKSVVVVVMRRPYQFDAYASSDNLKVIGIGSVDNPRVIKRADKRCERRRVSDPRAESLKLTFPARSFARLLDLVHVEIVSLQIDE